MFKKYNSIENTYRDEFILRVKGHNFDDKEYVILEKVHGANLSYYTNDGQQFYAAKRSGQVKPDEQFYNCQAILEQILPNLKAIWTDLKTENDNLEQLTIFGEVIGGSYPHPEVKRNPKALKVQKGIFYSPDNVFFAFDIVINAHHYLDTDKATELFEKHDLLHAPILFRGSLEACLNHPNDFDSNVPTQLGLPQISPNIVEGVIIKPLKTLYMNNGTRVIMKNKNEKWSEKSTFKKDIEPAEPLPEKVLKLQEAIATYVTENRLNNVLSKEGEVTHKDFGRILGLFNKDVIEDFNKDFASHLNELEKKERKLITKSFSKLSVALIKRHLK